MSTSVYCLINLKNNKLYYGKAADPKQRWYNHCWQARGGRDLPLHRAIRKYGAVQFELRVLATYATNEEACAEERRLIAATDPRCRYNVAPGGEGGRTMTPAQLDEQYAIRKEQYPEFCRLFAEGATTTEMQATFGASYNAVKRCARRNGLSFGKRRGEKARQAKPVVSHATMTREQYSLLRAEVARRSNKARGLEEEVRSKVRHLYFNESRTAQEVSVALGVTKGSVRAEVNRARSSMSIGERASWQRKHGSAVRSGSRNGRSLVRDIL
jgi:group I intron endonuclease